MVLTEWNAMKQVAQISTHDLAFNDIRKTSCCLQWNHFNELAHIVSVVLVAVIFGERTNERMSQDSENAVLEPHLNVHSTRLRAMAKSERIPCHGQLHQAPFRYLCLSYVSESECVSCIFIYFKVFARLLHSKNISMCPFVFPSTIHCMRALKEKIHYDTTLNLLNLIAAALGGHGTRAKEKEREGRR